MLIKSYYVHCKTACVRTTPHGRHRNLHHVLNAPAAYQNTYTYCIYSKEKSIYRTILNRNDGNLHSISTQEGSY